MSFRESNQLPSGTTLVRYNTFGLEPSNLTPPNHHDTCNHLSKIRKASYLPQTNSFLAIKAMQPVNMQGMLSHKVPRFLAWDVAYELAHSWPAGRLSMFNEDVAAESSSACKSLSFSLLTFSSMAWVRAWAGQIHCDRILEGRANPPRDRIKMRKDVTC